jgi:DNA primase
LARDGAAALQERIEQAADAWDYKLRFTVDAFGLDSIDGRHRVLDDMLSLLANAPRLAGSIRESLILSRLAQRVGLDERTVRDRLKDLRRHPSGKPAAGTSAPPIPVKPLFEERSRDDQLEAELLEILFVAPEWVETVRAEIGPDDFRNESLRALLLTTYDLAEAGESPAYGLVTATLEDADQKRLAARINDRAQEKDIASQLHDEHGATDGRPKFLQQAIEAVKKRRERVLAEQAKRQLAQQEAAGLSEDAKQQLRRLAQHHQKRALGTR